MMIKKAIILVGLMGAGKSKAGIELGKLLKLPFADSDDEIEMTTGYTVSEIFEKLGESEFRKNERDVMLRLLSGRQIVLASGGGAFIQTEIRSVIKEKAISVWLKADIDVLAERLSHLNQRPLLRQGEDIRSQLEKLAQERYPVYAEADITVVTDRQTPQNVAYRIKKEIEERYGR